MLTQKEIDRHQELEDADFLLRSPLARYDRCIPWARRLFRAKGLASLLSLAALFLSPPLAAAEAPAPRLKPVSTVTVKVVSAEHYAKDATKAQAKTLWRITTADSDSCVAWVSTKAPNVKVLELEAFMACQVAIDRAVDAEHAMAERK